MKETRSHESAWLQSPMRSPYDMLLGIERHLGLIEGRQDYQAEEVRRHLGTQDQALDRIETRVAKLEARPEVIVMDPPKPTATVPHRFLHETVAFLRAVASPREWIIGAFLVALAFKGAVSPDQVVRLLSAAIGLPLK